MWMSGLFGLALLLLQPIAQADYEQPELTRTLTRLSVPRSAPDFELPDLDGHRHRLSGYRGKVVLLNFWATWCPPCRREMPSMERLYQKLKAESFMVLAVNQQEAEDDVFAFTGQLDPQPTFPILLDAESQTTDLYAVRGLPASVIVDRDGRIVYRAVGGRAFDHPDIEQAIRALLR
jgi:thiol-disulfide isomerase/thioredoxin